MKVSVITICYNSEKTIEDTIRSVISQSHTDIEYIIVDGNSTDSTISIIKSFSNQVTNWVSEPDKSLYDALNKGLAMATGEVVGFLHSDDMFADNQVIASVVDSFDAGPVDSVYGDIQYVDQLDTDKTLTFRKSGKFRRIKFWFGWSPPHPTFYMKRALYEKYGGFDISFKIAADYDTLLRYLIRERVTTIYNPAIRVKMRVGGISNKTMKNVSQKWGEDHRAMKKNNFGNPITLFLKTMRPVAHFYRSPKYLFE